MYLLTFSHYFLATAGIRKNRRLPIRGAAFYLITILFDYLLAIYDVDARGKFVERSRLNANAAEGIDAL